MERRIILESCLKCDMFGMVEFNILLTENVPGIYFRKTSIYSCEQIIERMCLDQSGE